LKAATPVLYKQIWGAFLANPGLNGADPGVLLIGILLAFRQVIRLFPKSAGSTFRIADPGLAVDRRRCCSRRWPLLGDRTGRMAISQQTMRHLLDSIATRLDEARDMSRYLTGLLVFLGLLGTFWGLIETVGSVGKVIRRLKSAASRRRSSTTLKEGLAAPLGGMGIAFSSSLFGLAGSLILGFLDLQAEPGAEPLLHRPRRLAVDHRAGIRSSAVASRRRPRRRSQPASSGLRAIAVEDMGSNRAPPRPWPTSPKPFRASCSTCAPSSR
jgi:hypothetical protein